MVRALPVYWMEGGLCDERRSVGRRRLEGGGIGMGGVLGGFPVTESHYSRGRQRRSRAGGLKAPAA